MKALGRILNVLVAVVLVFGLCGANFTERAYACSPPQKGLSQAPAVCPCCVTPAACCPSEPVPADTRPLDASASMGERLTADTLSLQPVKLLANVNIASDAAFSRQHSTNPTTNAYVSPVRRYLVFRALLI
jgi:hypothetical protein